MADIIPISPDKVAEAIKRINECGKILKTSMAEQLTRAVEAAAPINDVFWSDPRIGVNGASLLSKLGMHIQFLAMHYPEMMNSVLAGAGSTLTVNQDGTVTHTPPPPPEPEPEPEEAETQPE